MPKLRAGQIDFFMQHSKIDKKFRHFKDKFATEALVAYMAEGVAADSGVCGLNPAKDPMERSTSISQSDEWKKVTTKFWVL